MICTRHARIRPPGAVPKRACEPRAGAACRPHCAHADFVHSYAVAPARLAQGGGRTSPGRGSARGRSDTRSRGSAPRCRLHPAARAAPSRPVPASNGAAPTENGARNRPRSAVEPPSDEPRTPADRASSAFEPVPDAVVTPSPADPSTVNRRPSSVSAAQRENHSLPIFDPVVHRRSTASTGLSAPCPQDVHRRPDRNAAPQAAPCHRSCARMSWENIPTVWKSLCAKKFVTPAGDLSHVRRSQALGTTVPTTGDNHGDNYRPPEDGSHHPHRPPNGPPVAAPCPPHAATPADLG